MERTDKSLNPVAASPPDIPCAECGRFFPASEVIKLNNLWVCGRCKPLFLQRLQEGVIPVDAMADFRRVKNQLVARIGAPFPDRCVRCNAPAQGFRTELELYSNFGWKKTVLHVGLCHKHRVRREVGIAVAFLGVLGGFILMGAGRLFDHRTIALSGMFIVLFGVAWGMMTRLRVSASKFDGDKVWLKGVNKDFLAEMPEWDRELFERDRGTK